MNDSPPLTAWLRLQPTDNYLHLQNTVILLLTLQRPPTYLLLTPNTYNFLSKLAKGAVDMKFLPDVCD